MAVVRGVAVTALQVAAAPEHPSPTTQVGPVIPLVVMMAATVTIRVRPLTTPPVAVVAATEVSVVMEALRVSMSTAALAAPATTAPTRVRQYRSAAAAVVAVGGKAAHRAAAVGPTAAVVDLTVVAVVAVRVTHTAAAQVVAG